MLECLVDKSPHVLLKVHTRTGVCVCVCGRANKSRGVSCPPKSPLPLKLQLPDQEGDMSKQPRNYHNVAEAAIDL